MCVYMCVCARMHDMPCWWLEDCLCWESVCHDQAREQTHCLPQLHFSLAARTWQNRLLGKPQVQVLQYGNTAIISCGNHATHVVSRISSPDTEHLYRLAYLPALKHPGFLCEWGLAVAARVTGEGTVWSRDTGLRTSSSDWVSQGPRGARQTDRERSHRWKMANFQLLYLPDLR